jgi:hypothetical protein
MLPVNEKKAIYSLTEYISRACDCKFYDKSLLIIRKKVDQTRKKKTKIQLPNVYCS